MTTTPIASDARRSAAMAAAAMRDAESRDPSAKRQPPRRRSAPALLEVRRTARRCRRAGVRENAGLRRRALGLDTDRVNTRRGDGHLAAKRPGLGVGPQPDHFQMYPTGRTRARRSRASASPPPCPPPRPTPSGAAGRFSRTSSPGPDHRRLDVDAHRRRSVERCTQQFVAPELDRAATSGRLGSATHRARRRTRSCPSPTGHDTITGAFSSVARARPPRGRTPSDTTSLAATPAGSSTRDSLNRCSDGFPGSRAAYGPAGDLSGRSTTVPPRRSANCQSASTSDRCKSSGLPTITTSKRAQLLCLHDATVALRRGK